MKNNYGLPENKLSEISKKYKNCIYCGKEMLKPYQKSNHNDSATIEHLNHLPPWDNIETVAFCCGACNSSRGRQKIKDWFKSKYCLEKGINYNSVDKKVREYIDKYKN
jgi:hypothetical protein